MNKNGFAISTLLYGISLMGVMIVILLMSIMSSNRKNTSTLSKDIEEELNRISVTNTVINTDGEDKAYTIPQGESGWYKIQLWGAKNGDYTSGIIYLEEGQELYFDIGKSSDPKPSVVKVSNDNNTCHGGIVKTFTVIMRANGGGSGAISQNNASSVTTGSYISGYPGVRSYEPEERTEGTVRNDGYKPGGLSFKYRPYEVNNDNHQFADGTTPYAYAFLDPYIVLGANGNSNGKAKIDRVSTNERNNPPISLAPSVQKIKTITDSFTSNKKWREVNLLTYSNGEVSYIKSGSDAKGYDGNWSSLTGENKKSYSLSGLAGKNYYGLGIFHESTSNSITNQTLSFELNTTPAKTIQYKLNHEDGAGQYISFLRNSIWGLKNGEFPDNCDVWISKYKDKKALLSSNTATDTSVQTTLLADSQNQKWHLERISGNNYKIVETTKNYSLRINAVDEYAGNAEEGTALSTNVAYNGLKEEQWTLEDAGNGAFRIKSTYIKTRSEVGGKPLYLTLNSSTLTVNVLSGSAGSDAQHFYIKNQSY